MTPVGDSAIGEAGMQWTGRDAEMPADRLYLTLLALAVCGTLGPAAAEVFAR